MDFAKKLIVSIIISLLALPAYAFAHGTEAEHQREMMLTSYTLIGAGLLLVLFFVAYIVTKNKAETLKSVKKQEDRDKRHQLTKAAKKLKWAWIVSLIIVLISGGMALLGNGTSGAAQINIKHVHGLGYSNDGKRIFVPIHDGLAVYSDGKWGMSEGEKHDYMGFTTVDDGFYSSGHPAEGSDMANPFGVVKSTDEGKTLDILEPDLYGKIDFHTMSASYNTHTIYVMNPQPNTRMDSLGLYYTQDETKTWIKSEMKGLEKELFESHMQWIALAVHPTDDSVVAISTSSGLYLSKDYGNHFEKVLTDTQVGSLFFSSEDSLFIGTYSSKPSLLQLDLETNQTEEFNIPTLTEDAINYFAQNPLDKNEWVFTTIQKDVYLTTDRGANWLKIADQGKGISQADH
jgi:hypothetical protein